MVLEIMSRGGGRFLNIDGTCSVPARTVGVRTVGPGRCLFLTLGEDATLHSFAVAKSDKVAHLTPLFQMCVMVLVAGVFFCVCF